MGVAGRQQTEERLLLVSGISIGQNHRVFLRHRPLYMVRLSVVYPNKRLLDGNGPLQHGLHRYVIGPAEETADIDHMVAVGNQGIYAYSVVPDHAPPRRSDPAAEAAHTIRDFQLAQVHIVPVLPDRQSGWQCRVAQYQSHILTPRTAACGIPETERFLLIRPGSRKTVRNSRCPASSP